MVQFFASCELETRKRGCQNAALLANENRCLIHPENLFSALVFGGLWLVGLKGD